MLRYQFDAYFRRVRRGRQAPRKATRKKHRLRRIAEASRRRNRR